MAFLRPALGIVAALSVLTSTLGALVIWGAFEVRQEHIAEHLCESPDSDCDGMCFLDKRMESHHGHGDEHDAPKAVAAPTLQAVAPPASDVPADRWRDRAAPTPRAPAAPKASAVRMTSEMSRRSLMACGLGG